MGILAGFALLLKGPIGIVLPSAALIVFGLVERISLLQLCKTTTIVGAIGIAIAAPWYLWANAATDGEFFRVFFFYHHFNRAFGGAESLAGHPFWYYLPRFAADFLPWTPLFIAAVIARRWRGDADARFGIIWLVVMIAVLSISRFKRADYLLPAYAGAAIFVGCAVERWYLSRTPPTRTRLTIGFAAVLAIVPIGWFAFDRVVTAKEEAARDQTQFAVQIREIAPTPSPIVLFRVESHQLVYHVGRPVHTLVEWADLRAQTAHTGVHYVVTRAEFVDEVREMIARPIEIIARNDTEVRVQRPFVLLRIAGDPWPTTPRD
jgi:hypothetical protein